MWKLERTSTDSNEWRILVMKRKRCEGEQSRLSTAEQYNHAWDCAEIPLLKQQNPRKAWSCFRPHLGPCFLLEKNMQKLEREAWPYKELPACASARTVNSMSKSTPVLAPEHMIFITLENCIVTSMNVFKLENRKSYKTTLNHSRALVTTKKVQGKQFENNFNLPNYPKWMK